MINLNLSQFTKKYAQVLTACVNRVRRLSERGQTYVTAAELAEYVAKELPTLFRETFGPKVQREVRAWRVRSMLAHASFLGAYEAMGLRAVMGHGLTLAKPAKAVRKAA